MQVKFVVSPKIFFKISPCHVRETMEGTHGGNHSAKWNLKPANGEELASATRKMINCMKTKICFYLHIIKNRLTDILRISGVSFDTHNNT